jgi:hypothetical protein
MVNSDLRRVEIECINGLIKSDGIRYFLFPHITIFIKPTGIVEH